VSVPCGDMLVIAAANVGLPHCYHGNTWAAHGTARKLPAKRSAEWVLQTRGMALLRPGACHVRLMRCHGGVAGSVIIVIEPPASSPWQHMRVPWDCLEGVS
jgi:hypothetical protein